MANICYQFSGSNFFNIALTYLTYYLKMKLPAAKQRCISDNRRVNPSVKKNTPRRRGTNLIMSELQGLTSR